MSTCALELFAVIEWMTRFVQRCAGKRVLIAMNNRESKRVLSRGYSACPRLMPLIRTIRMMCVRHNVSPTTYRTLEWPLRCVKHGLPSDATWNCGAASNLIFKYRL